MIDTLEYVIVDLGVTREAEVDSWIAEKYQTDVTYTQTHKLTIHYNNFSIYLFT